MKNIVHKSTAFALSIILLFSALGNVSASDLMKAVDAENLSGYNGYTIDLTVPDSAAHPLSAPENDSSLSVDRAITFVESLNLEEKGFDYIEEACLMELETYKTEGVTLEQYTVLTPKSGPTYFGTLNGADYYYTDTSVSVGTKTWYEKLTDTGISDADWLNALGNLLFILANHTAYLPIAAGLSAGGIAETAHISSEDEFRMAVAFTNCYQRGIGRYDAQGNFRIVYYDQRGNATYDIDFCPGNPADYGNDIDIDFYERHTAVEVKTYEYDNSKESIMQVCQTYYNRPSSGYVKYSLTSAACNLIHEAT